MSIVDKLKEKYQPLLNKIDYKNINNKWNINVFLFQKWAYRVGKNWYGFDLDGVPFVWAQIIDEFLTWLEEKCEFEIHQIKLKRGGLRFHVQFPNYYDADKYELAKNEISKLEDWLQHPALVY